MTAQQETDALMREMIVFARQMLSGYGEFYPFGGIVDADGEIGHVGATSEENEYPKSAELLEVLNGYLTEMAAAGKCRATARALNVSVTLPDGTATDAIHLLLDHRDNFSVEVILPFSKTQDGLVFGEAVAQEGKYAIFGNGQA